MCTRGEEKIHTEELNGLYAIPNVVRGIKSRRMRWANHVARMGERRGIYRVLVGKPEGKRPRVEPGINGRILKWLCSEQRQVRALVNAVKNLLVP